MLILICLINRNYIYLLIMDYIDYFKNSWCNLKENLTKHVKSCISFQSPQDDFEQIEIKNGYSLTTKYDSNPTTKSKKFEEYKILDYNTNDFVKIINTLNYTLIDKDKNDINLFNLTNVQESQNLFINTGIKLEREEIINHKLNLITEEWFTIYRKSENDIPLMYIVNKVWTDIENVYSINKDYDKDNRDFKFEVKYENIQQGKKILVTGSENNSIREIEIKDTTTLEKEIKSERIEIYKEEFIQGVTIDKNDK